MDSGSLTGQDEAVALLGSVVKAKRVGHAYLFHGPSGVGKTKAAIAFARALLCESPDAEGAFCGRCDSCRDAAALRHPDLALLIPLPTFRTEGRTEKQADEARAEARASILARYAREAYFVPTFARPTAHSVEDLARARQFLSLTPRHEGGAKVLIVKEAEAMTGPAAHAFLKILEEPHPNRTIILGTRRVRALLPTIASRCIPVRFRPLPDAFIAKALQAAHGVSPNVARLAAGIAQGSLDRAFAYFQDPMDGTGRDRVDESDFSKLRSAAIDLFVHPSDTSILGPLRRARLERDRSRFRAAVSFAVHYYRDVVRVSLLGEGTPIAHEDLRRQILADSRSIALADLRKRVGILEEIGAAVASNVTAAYAVASAQHRMGLGPEVAPGRAPR